MVSVREGMVFLAFRNGGSSGGFGTSAVSTWARPAATNTPHGQYRHHSTSTLQHTPSALSINTRHAAFNLMQFDIAVICSRSTHPSHLHFITSITLRISSKAGDHGHGEQDIHLSTIG
ncbi:hypothetical protein CF319_g1094 [Tilletia indica]|nr:hypothetical protein CF319_g1094 [Tilletia indica]